MNEPTTKRSFSWFLLFCCALTLVQCAAIDDQPNRGIDNLLDVLNLRRLYSRIEEGKWRSYDLLNENSAPCIADFYTYQDALRRGSSWANMIYDATGRYSSQFTFGNGFWLGSKTICLELDKMVMKNMVPMRQESKQSTRDKSSITLLQTESSQEVKLLDKVLLDEKDLNGSFPLIPQEQKHPSSIGRSRRMPPFRVRFYIARIEISLPKELSPVPRQVLLGICMPRSCSPQTISHFIDISSAEDNLLTLSAVKKEEGVVGRSVKVVHVRPVPGDYDWKKDPKTYVLGGVTIVIFVLMAMAEMYESFQIWRRQRFDKMNDCPKSRSKDTERGNNNNREHIITMRKSLVHSKENTPRALLPRLLLCFSVRRNGRKILSVSDEAAKSDDQSLACLHGLRSISLAWVIMVHTYLQVFAIAENKKLRSVTERDIGFQTISNATFSVDTFFTISGLLVAYLYFCNKEKRKSNTENDSMSKNKEIETCSKTRAITTDSLLFLKLLGYRFLRLTPPYLWSIGIAEVGMRWQINDSVFEPKIADGVTCAKYWWRNAIYINSLFPQSEMCMLWSWYMANDTQFYALGIILLLVVVRYFRFAAVAGFAFLISSWITTAIIAFQYEYHVSIQEPFALFDQLYDKPWTRLGPYLVGMFTGWLLYETSFRIKIPKIAVLSGWVLSLCCMGGLVYGVALVGRPLPPSGAIGLSLMGSAAYASLGHTMWSISVAWVIVACSTGNGGWISGLLCWSALRPLSRLAYCAYLIHPLVMMFTAFRMVGPLHLHNSIVVMIYLGYMITSYLLAFFISLCFEAPAVSLLKMIFQPQRSNTSENTDNDQENRTFQK